MDLWEVREQSLADLEGSLKREYELLIECLTLIEKYIKRFRQYTINDQIHKPFAAVCFHLLIRVHHLAHSLLSQALDGLMLESFSLLRTLVEGAQMIVYISEDPTRVDKLLSENPPTAGKIAKEIKAVETKEQELKSLSYLLKDFINDSYVHFAVRAETLRPLELSYDEGELKGALRTFFAYLWLIVLYAQRCILRIDPKDMTLKGEVEVCRSHGKQIYGSLVGSITLKDIESSFPHYLKQSSRDIPL